MNDVLRPYPEYKDSGLHWLGRIPKHWNEKRAKYFFREVDERSTTGEETLMSVSHKTGVTPRKSNVTMFKAASNVGHKICRPGDLAINTLWAWMAALGVSRETGIVSPAYGVYRQRDVANYHPDFIDFLLRTQSYAAEYRCRSTGITTSRLRLYPIDFLCIPLVQPPPHEQELIVSYLRKHDVLVRKFIRNRRQLIEVLNEQKHSAINRIVIRGLDSSVPFKQSGDASIDRIPSHWNIRRIKYVCHFAYGDSLPAESRHPGDTPVFGSNGQVGTHTSANTQGPCLVIGRKGSFGKVNYSSVPVFAIDTAFFIDERLTTSCLRWLYYILTWARLDAVTKDTAIPGLDRNEAYAKYIPFCPTDEQRTIARHLDAALIEVEKAIEMANREIDLVREYRTRLISDVVTGRLDVRHLAPPPSSVEVDEVNEIDAEEALDNELEGVEEGDIAEEALNADD